MGDAILTYSTITEGYEPKDGNTPALQDFLTTVHLKSNLPGVNEAAG